MSSVKRLLWYRPGLGQAGGGERLLLEGLKFFNEHGIEAVLFVEDQQILDEALFNGQYDPKVLRVELKNKNNEVLFQKNIIQKVYYWIELVRAILKYNPDIIIANGQPEAKKVWYLSMIHFWKSIPYVCFIHGTFFQFPDENEKYSLIFRKHFAKIRDADPVYKDLISKYPKYQSFLSRISSEVESLMRYFAVKRSRAVFVLTKKAKNEIELLYGHSNVCVFHGAFHQELLNISNTQKDKKVELGIEDKLIFLSLCRLVDKKRVDIIIKSFALFNRNHPDSVLLIGGTGPERENLELLAKELKIKEKIKFLGFINENELIEYYRCTDVFVSADNADYDITSIVALAVGKRVVASSQHEFDNDVNKLNLLFQADPIPQTFAQAFTIAIKDKRECDIDLKNKIMNRYSWEKYFEDIIVVMNVVLTNR
jgi:glycosyltransferase involved in cell wall biosynthesis